MKTQLETSSPERIRYGKLCCILIAYGIREGEGPMGIGGEDLTIFDRDSKYTI